MVLVRDLMVPNPNTVHPDMPLSQALTLMRDVGCRHLPVVENGFLVGIISERDVRLGVKVPALDMAEVESHEMRNISAGEIMASDPITANLDTTIQQAARWFNVNDIGALPVVENGVLVGIVTIYDVLHYIADIPDLVTAKT